MRNHRPFSFKLTPARATALVLGRPSRLMAGSRYCARITGLPSLISPACALSSLPLLAGGDGGEVEKGWSCRKIVMPSL